MLPAFPSALKKLSAVVFCILIFQCSQGQQSSVSFEQWISLKQVSNPVISPDGAWVVYTVTSTDWAANRYDAELWLAKTNSPASAFQLTRTSAGSSTSAAFSPDGKWVSFLADRGDKTQLYIISPSGGEAMQVTKEEQGINSYAWSHDGKQIAFTESNADSKKEKAAAERYGGFDVEDEGFKQNSLWLINFDYDSISMAGRLPCYTAKQDSAKAEKASPCKAFVQPVKLLSGAYYIADFAWNPDDKSIIYNFQPDSRVKASERSDIALLDVATKQTTVLVSNPSADNFQAWGKDGKQFVYSTHVADTMADFYSNNRLFIYDIATKNSKEILTGFDEDKSVAEWNENGIYFAALDKMKSYLYQYRPENDQLTKLNINLDVISATSFAKQSGAMALAGRNFSGLNEVYVADKQLQLTAVSNATAQISTWDTPVNEIVHWKSKDGSTIEGVLLKPKNFDPHKKYPLLVVIHGGPTGVDRPEPVPTYVYPITQWCEKGAVVLRVNYRGSAGYGQKFRALNVNNLGVGDMWDVVSGVDYLAGQGFIDTSKMGCMGWSQGGYISAFLTTNTTIFKAISVGAGISDWMTYYVNTDITPFTREYLTSTPWSNPAMYQKTSPITNITKARTPTLIQHGELDRRVPIPDAYELYRGLLDNGVTARLIVYKGFGHGITKPKERLAAVWHNWVWFNHYVFGDKEEVLPGTE